MGILGDIGDGIKGGINHGLAIGEDLVDEGRKKVGEGVDWATGKVGDGLDHVGLHDAADAVEDWGDEVASDLGATPGEQQLGQTEEANELVHGNPARISESAKHLKDFHTAFDHVAQGMKKVDASGWAGEGGDAFREKFGVHPTKWAQASDACDKAAAALEAYADTVKWAQGRAKEAVELYKKGRKASDDAVAAYNKRVDAYNAKVKANEDPGPRPEPFRDPGKADITKARETLAEARKQRNTSASEAGTKVKGALAHAPAEPPPLDRLGNNLVDGYQAVNTELTHVVGGALKGTAGLVNFARGLNPTDPYNLTHPAAYLQNVSMTLSGLVSTAAHPERIVTAAVDGFKKDPSEFVGRLIPELIGTKGAGLARSGVRLGLKTGAKEGLESGLRREARNGAEQHPQTRAQQPHEKTCEKDPVDVASGHMVLAQGDVSLPGRLPLVFKREFESSYRAGRWFGPTWSSTVDQRLEIDTEGIVLVGEHGLLLTFPHPAPGAPTLPHRGPQWRLDRTAQGYTVTDPRSGRVLSFGQRGEYEALLERIDDRSGHWIAFEYDEDTGAPCSVYDSAGRRLLLTSREGRVTSLRLAGGAPDGADQEIVRYGYGPDGHLAEVTGSSGTPLRFAYDEPGRITAWTDTNGNTFSYTYDDRDRCVGQSGGAGHLRSVFRYEDGPEPGFTTTAVTDSLGHTTRYRIDRHRRVVTAVDACGAATHHTYDDKGRLLSRTDPLGGTTSFTYDQDGNQTSVTRPDGHTAHAEYAHGLPVKVIGADGTAMHQQYDERGNRVRLTAPGGRTTRFAYDSAGHLASVTDALGDTTRVRCDAAGLPTHVTDPLGATTRYERDAFGRPVAITDPLGATTRLEWTVESRLARHISPDGGVQSWTYDGEGNCTSHTTATGAVTRFEYTDFDLLTARTDPDGARHEFTYDTELRLTKVTNPLGLTWSYDHDPAGRVVSETDFDGRTAGYRHDAAGRLAARTTVSGDVVTFERDALGRVVRKEAGGRVTTYAYDFTGQLAEARGPDVALVRLRDRAGLLRSETVDGRTITYTYDQLGRRVSRRTPAGATSTWAFDAAGNRTELATSGRTVAFSFDATGRETARRFSSGIGIHHTFDALGRLTGQTLRNAREESLAHRAYVYRPDGNLSAVEDPLLGACTFGLDPTGRVTTVQGANWTERYAYDASGNQTDAEWPDAPVGREAAGPRAYTGTKVVRAGRVHYTYDEAGRVVERRVRRLSGPVDVWRYSWDVEDRLTGVTTPDGTRWRYRYDPTGRRTAKLRLAADGRSVAERTDFTWDGPTLCEQSTTVAESPNVVTLTWDHAGARPLTQTERIHAAGAPQTEVDSRFFAIVTDLVGTPRELVDESGATAWRARSTLWGTTAWSKDSTAYTPLRFPGQYFDPETGLHQNYFRHYDPATGRYLTGDPLGLTPAPNPASYVPNPHTWSDPLGLSPCPPHLFRGTTRGFEGSPGVQRHGITPTSSDPGVATVFATQAERFGDAVVEIYPRGALNDVPVHEGYIAREAEWPVELSPAELSSRASVQVPSSVARDILSEMGIDVPRRIGNGDIDPLLEYDIPKLTPEQISHFVEEAHRRA